MSQVPGDSDGTGHILLAERRSRNFGLILDACIRPAVIALILCLLLAGPVLLGVETVFRTGFSFLMVLSTLGVLFLALLCVTALCYRKLWRSVGVSIRIFPDRLVYARKAEVVDYPWDDIREFCCSRLDEYRSALGFDQTYSESRNEYRFTHENGHRFEFAEKFSRKELVPIADYVEQGLLERRLPVLRAQLQEDREPLQFGPLGLGEQGIYHGRSLLPWEEVDFEALKTAISWCARRTKRSAGVRSRQTRFPTAVYSSLSPRKSATSIHRCVAAAIRTSLSLLHGKRSVLTPWITHVFNLSMAGSSAIHFSS